MFEGWSTLKKLVFLRASSGGKLPAEYKRLKGFSMDDNCYWEITDFKLYGSDTIKFSFMATAACNVLGSYSSGSATTNYSLYVTTSSGNYLRYGNGTYNSTIVANTRYNVTVTPTGSHGMKTDSTWTAKTFTSANDFCIATTSTSAQSAKLKGSLYGEIEIAGRAKFIPCERVSDGKYGYYESVSGTFYAPATGTPVSLGYD